MDTSSPDPDQPPSSGGQDDRLDSSDVVGRFWAAVVPVAMTLTVAPMLVIPTVWLRVIYLVAALAFWFVIMTPLVSLSVRLRKRQLARKPHKNPPSTGLG